MRWRFAYFSASTSDRGCPRKINENSPDAGSLQFIAAEKGDHCNLTFGQILSGHSPPHYALISRLDQAIYSNGPRSSNRVPRHSRDPGSGAGIHSQGASAVVSVTAVSGISIVNPAAIFLDEDLLVANTELILDGSSRPLTDRDKKRKYDI